MRQLVNVGAVGLDGEDPGMPVGVLADRGRLGKQSVCGPERRTRARSPARRRSEDNHECASERDNTRNDRSNVPVHVLLLDVP